MDGSSREPVNLYDAKTHLSELVDRASTGEEIIIARNGKPVARLVPLERPRKQRRFGFWKSKVWVSPDFDAPLPEEIHC